MKLLLDTHVFLWAVSGDERLPGRIRNLLAADENQLLVSVASLWEIVIKAATGGQFQWSNSKDIGELENWVRRLGAEILPIKAGHAIGTWNFREWAHKDPFDRMLASQAVAERATLVTADSELQKRPELQWMWDA